VGQNKDCDQGGREVSNSGYAKRPARAEVVRYPAHDRGAERHSSECDADPEGHHPSPYRWFCRELHETVGAIGERQGGRTDDYKSGRKPPVSRREAG
jgi:hypothetical protein